MSVLFLEKVATTSSVVVALKSLLKFLKTQLIVNFAVKPAIFCKLTGGGHLQ